MNRENFTALIHAIETRGNKPWDMDNLKYCFYGYATSTPGFTRKLFAGNPGPLTGPVMVLSDFLGISEAAANDLLFPFMVEAYPKEYMFERNFGPHNFISECLYPNSADLPADKAAELLTKIRDGEIVHVLDVGWRFKDGTGACTEEVGAGGTETTVTGQNPQVSAVAG